MIMNDNNIRIRFYLAVMRHSRARSPDSWTSVVRPSAMRMWTSPSSWMVVNIIKAGKKPAYPEVL